MPSKKKNIIKIKLVPTSAPKKGYKYRIHASDLSRKRAINKSIKEYAKRTGKSLQESAQGKKKRLNVLRIYRKNTDPKGVANITKDMVWINTKYSLGGKVKNITKNKGSKFGLSNTTTTTNISTVSIYGEDWCPFCREAKSIMGKNGKYYRISDLSEKERNLLKKKTGEYKFIPIIFVGDKFIGGLEQFKMMKSKKSNA